MRIQLSEHFSYTKLLRFVFPSIIMMIFSSIYSVVDGLFVSNFVGKTQFAAVNFIMPFLMAIGTVGFMIGTGGSAVIAKTLGQGEKEKACRYFSMFIYTAIGFGVILSIFSVIFIQPIAELLGAEGDMLHYCVIYARILIISMTAFILQFAFQSLLVAAEKPQIGLLVAIAAGITNIVFDYLLIAVFHWGLVGAAVATALSQMIGAVIPMIYFLRKNNSLLRLVKTKLEWRVLWRACVNGSSELMTNLSASVVNILYNFQLMKLVGENGVAAYGVIMYVNFIFIAIFLGYSMGSAPIVGYHYGAGNHGELKNLLHKSLCIISISAIFLTIIAELLSAPLAKLFVGYDDILYTLTRDGFRIYTLSFLLCGFNIYGSSFFTSLNNGLISAVISFLRTLVFQVICILIIPIFLGVHGIWLSIVTAEIAAIFVTFSLLFANRRKYYYG